MAEMVDFYPTLAELAGLPVPNFVSGVSLAAALRDPSAVPRESALTHYANGYSIRTKHYRFTQWGQGGEEGSELYDHRRDPGEMENLAADPKYAATVKQLTETLGSRIADAQKPPPGIKQIGIVSTRKVPQR
jgi:arylsulfatase A-like enzyme